jgi:hypothetical protein
MSTPEEIAAKLDPPQDIKGSKLTTWVMDQIGRTDITLGLSVVALIIEKRQMDFAMNSLRKLKFKNPCDIIREVKTMADFIEVENFDKFVTSILVKCAEEFDIPELEVMLEHNLVKYILPPSDNSTGTCCLPCMPRPRR